MKQNFIIAILLSVVFPVTAAWAEDEFKFYGAIKASVNATDDGADNSLSVSNNDSRIGIKGNKDLENNLSVVYQIELGVDTTERNGIDSGRNSFLGLKGNFGKALLGQHDTPLKDIRGHGAELFDDTIGGARSMISAVADEGGAKLDNRVKNAIFYYTPKMSGTQVFLLYSADNSKDPAKPDDNDNDLFGASVTYLKGPLYLGLGVENRSNPGADDTESIRLAGSYKFGLFQIGGIIESADNGNNDSLTRDAYVINGRYNISKKTLIGIQFGMVEDYDGSSDTGGSNISLGIEHKLAKPTTVYAVLSATSNDVGASFGLAQGGIQDRVTAATPGDSVSGVSVGIVHKF